MTFNLSAAPEQGHLDIAAPGQFDAAGLEARALRREGLTLWVAGQLAEAAECLQQAARLAPADPRILSDLGSLLYAASGPAAAIDYLAASLEIDPTHAQTWLLLANASQGLGDKVTAEHAFLAALEIEPNSPAALTGLGLLNFELGRFENAEHLLTAAVAHRGAPAPAVHACLGEARRVLGRFREARRAFEEAAAGFPNEAAILRKYARVALIDTAIDAPVEAALETYAKIAGPHAEETETVLRDAFQALCGFGHTAGAIRLAKALLAFAPDDPIIRYHLDALEGSACTRAPDSYLIACFDKFAPNFETQLVDTLHYSVPSECEKLLSELGRTFGEVLDLGCGTGLAAPFLSKLGKGLTGVDISPGMLEKAKERGLYHSLIESEAGQFLTASQECFDLVAALDVLVYFGDLSSIFDRVAQRLSPGGLFVISFEIGAGADYRLRPCGRFAHDPAYVAMIAARNFKVVSRIATTLRLEANAQVAGEVVAFERL
jgi:predicted TPR repeat methyltransferase